MQAFASTKPEYAAAKEVFNVLVFFLAAFLPTWTTATLIQMPPDWSEFFQSLFFGFWLPLSLLPFFYLFGYYAVTEKTLARFRAFQEATFAKSHSLSDDRKPSASQPAHSDDRTLQHDCGGGRLLGWSIENG